jgi:lipopolysaccharide export LptBFGC system permease protein LptF
LRRGYVYLFKYLGARAFFVVAILTVLASVITWMEGIKSLYAGEQWKALYFVALNLPSFLATSLVPGVLLGVALGLHQLGKRHELVAFYAQGLSPLQIIGWPTFSLGLIFASFYAILLHGAIPATKHQSDALASQLGISDPVTQLFSVQRHWIKTEEAFIYVDHVLGKNKVSGVVWIDKKKNEAPTLIAMGKEAEFRSSEMNSEKVVFVIRQANVFYTDQPSHTSLIQPDCEKALEGFREGKTVEVGATICPMVAESRDTASEIKPILFEREIPRSLGAVLQLTGHPEGFFTDELEYLLGHASQYGYSLNAYSATLKARYWWPFVMLLLAMLAAWWGVRSTPATGIYFPFVVMLFTYLGGVSFIHFVSKIS